jgi:hypothetical protein
MHHVNVFINDRFYKSKSKRVKNFNEAKRVAKEIAQKYANKHNQNVEILVDAPSGRKTIVVKPSKGKTKGRAKGKKKPKKKRSRR